MNRSVLLQLTRDSIQEVLQAKTSIEKQTLLQKHPLLEQKVKVTINISIDDELFHSYHNQGELALIDAVIIGAKKAAFEKSTPLTTSQYLHCEIELILDTPQGVISQKDPPILEN
ncbi:MAG TPA: AMMECR1 domain-containing protein [Sulfurimonas autotrophica]|nr:AMMECR1 domain-containing protein [Sulfurimonas autotrophica]